jgi:8-oxo-dGTP pyrophosphatase MutT (NUDIX family)
VSFPGDGDGWVVCDLGHRHWGRHGAAGLLLYRRLPGQPDRTEVLLQHRAEWSHHGGTWGVLGGARGSAESVLDTALREAHEEATLSGRLTVDGQHDDEHGGWGYRTVLAQASAELVAEPASAETVAVSWWQAEDVPALRLHPGFDASWPILREALRPWHIVVDVANVMGAQPDGWWRDRAGAAERLIRRGEALAVAGLTREQLDGVRLGEVLHRRWPRLTMVVEGAARPVARRAFEHVRVVAASGSGDDAVLDEVLALEEQAVLVVTADRELRGRAAAAGANVIGPRWLLERLPREG